MAKLKRNCDKCSNKVGDWCTMQKDMKKAETVLCDGFKVVPKNPKPIWKEQETKFTYRIDKDKVGDDFYKFLTKGGAWSFNPDNFGRIF